MTSIISDENLARLLSFSREKKLAFLLLLYERMLPELYSFFSGQRLNISILQYTYKIFWLYLSLDAPKLSWEKLRNDILAAIPDSEEFGSLEASFAMNATFVAADIAGYLADQDDQHVVDAIGYARDSLDAKAVDETGVIAISRAVEDFVDAHPLVEKEIQRQEEDIRFLASIKEPPWSKEVISLLHDRAQKQTGLLNNT